MFYLHIPEYKQEKIKMRTSYFGRFKPLVKRFGRQRPLVRVLVEAILGLCLVNIIIIQILSSQM